jgi:hypothetical protein
MRSRIKVTLCLLAATVTLSFSAQAFDIKTRSDNPAITDAALRAAVNEIAAEVGNSIPQSPDIKVYVYTRALPSKIEGQVIYLHRVQLTKAFSGEAPYPTHAWLPIKSAERYGVDDPVAVRAKLDETLREFFTQMKSVDPVKGSAE